MELKFLKKEKSFKKTNLFFNTNLYWQLAVCGAFILSVASCFFGYYLFINTNNESISQSPIYDYKRNEVVNKKKIYKFLSISLFLAGGKKVKKISFFFFIFFAPTEVMFGKHAKPRGAGCEN